MQLKLKMFHEGNAPLANGHTRDSLLRLSDDEFESNHGFIQWAFPTNVRSQQNVAAPILDLQSTVWLANDPTFITFLEDMTAHFLGFLKRNKHWIKAYDHNHLRVSRAIDAIRLLHSWELAGWFHERVLEFADDADQVMPKAAAIWENKADPRHDRVAGAFVGLAIGDALGAPVEFCRRGTFELVEGFRAGGKFDLPAGAWTDDTAMALCLAQSLIEMHEIEPKDLLERFARWLEFGENTSTGVAVGVGQNTLRVLGEFKRNGTLEAVRFGSKNDGNGSLMRLAPVACGGTFTPEMVISMASAQSRTTHASDIADECCQFTALLINELLCGNDYVEARRNLTEGDWSYPLQSILDIDYTEFSDVGIRASGYVVDTLQAALWAVETSQSFEQAVLKAVNLGDDADTVGAVAGQIAGARYGYTNVPNKLKHELINERELYVMSQFLSAL